jgi:thiamine biosynthesis protein ThiS
MPGETTGIEIVVNGESAAVPRGQTVLGLLESLSIKSDRVAVELDRRIVKQPEWRTTVLRPGASVEIVQFVGGG